METSRTQMDPLTDMLALQLPTAAILATLSLEVVPPGSVRVKGAGVGQLQLVKVSSVTLINTVCVSNTYRLSIDYCSTHLL